MKIWKQEDVNKVLPDKNGVRHYPANSSFAEWCRFAKGCSFAEWRMRKRSAMSQGLQGGIDYGLVQFCGQ